MKNNNDAIKTRNSTNIESVRESVNYENGEKSENPVLAPNIARFINFNVWKIILKVNTFW